MNELPDGNSADTACHDVDLRGAARPTLDAGPTLDADAALDVDAAEVLRRELHLLKPQVRADRDAVLALLHPNFCEIGASGQIWTRTGLAEALAGESPAAESPAGQSPAGQSPAGQSPAGQSPAAEPGSPAGGGVSGPDALPARVADLVCTRLAADVVQLTYTAIEADRRSRRSSIWMRGPGGPWLLRFHQGTVASGPVT